MSDSHLLKDGLSLKFFEQLGVIGEKLDEDPLERVVVLDPRVLLVRVPDRVLVGFNQGGVRPSSDAREPDAW